MIFKTMLNAARQNILMKSLTSLKEGLNNNATLDFSTHNLHKLWQKKT